MRNYRITKDTLAILPYGIKKSLVYEGRNRIIVDSRPIKIIDFNCMFYGSTLSDRIKCTTNLTGFTYKAPVQVRNEANMVFFPTSSPRLKECAWISIEKLKNHYFDEAKKLSIITFTNNISIEVDVSHEIIGNQILRADRLESILLRIKVQK